LLSPLSYPEYLAEPGNVSAAKQVARYDDEQPKPQHEHEDGKGVSQEISECEATLKKHYSLPAAPFESIFVIAMMRSRQLS
jgi:hypothetical protein